MSRRVIGEIQLLLLISLSASDNFKLRLASYCCQGTIPPDIGKLVKLTRLDVSYTNMEGENKIRVTVITCPGA